MTEPLTAYLDCAASTPLRSEAWDAMAPILRDGFGNPSGQHAVARSARKALEEARDQVASVVGASPHDVVFTSGGTESDNLAIKGLTDAERPVAVCGATEHHAILDPVVAGHGRVAGVDGQGRVDLDRLASALGHDVGVVSVMAVNNETGVVADLAAVAEVVRDLAPHAVLHTDAVQAANWLDLADVFRHVDAMSLAGHKFGGPKGTGALVLSERARPRPMLIGGGQEHERRSGTQNVAGAVGFAAALDVTARQRSLQCARIGALSDRILNEVSNIESVQVTVEPSLRVPGICHLTTEVSSEDLLLLLDREGVMASAASSCASGALEPSHVLVAMGRSERQAAGALRISMAHSTVDAEVDRLLQVLPGLVSRLSGGRSR
ncbi:MAG: aminotransferase class V-fold PLP-dependent enzyme [Acidimicrobiales bacterium]|nr:aminotransferase class V-fold PLP-dependent enzyme [Acidimicrobiales bacterium]